MRRATVEDAAELVRLRVQMFYDMGRDPGPEDAPWRGAAHDWFGERLADEKSFAAFVVEGPGGRGIVSCAAGICDRYAPGPTSPGGLVGHLFNVATDVEARRRGYARACVDALMEWFEADTEVRVINLNATDDGARMYRDMGFHEPRYPALQFRME